MKTKQSVVAAALAGVSVTALTLFIPWVAARAVAQSAKVGEEQDTAGARLAALTPDPVKFPVPRTKWDGKPDFSGVYWTSTYLPNDAAKIAALKVLDSLFRPEALAARREMNPEDSPGMHCWPESPASGGMHPVLNNQLVSAPGFLAVINEYGANYRIVPTDGRPHNASAKPTFQGDAVGHWEGDTLVVDVTNFRVRNKLGMQFQDTWSDAMHVVERWTRPDARFMEYEAVVEDPKTLTAPWTTPKIRRERMAYDVSQENLCVPDEVMEAINREQLEASEKGIRRRRGTGQGQLRDSVIPPIVAPR